MTKIAKIEVKFFPVKNLPYNIRVLEGSFQKWVDNAHEAVEDYGKNFLPYQKKIHEDEIHKIAIFDIRILNCDRHLKNFLVDNNLVKTHPIDHGFILPGNANSLRFDWINFPQARIPFSMEVKMYIELINPDEDIKVIRKKFPSVSADTLKMFKISTLLLKIAVKKGLNASQIADLYMRRKHEDLTKWLLNKFLPIPCEKPSYFAATIWPQLRNINPSSWNAQLENEVEMYLKSNSYFELFKTMVGV